MHVKMKGFAVEFMLPRINDSDNHLLPKRTFKIRLLLHTPPATSVAEY